MPNLFPDIELIPGFVPVNMATAANTGLRVKLDDCERLAIVLFKGAGSAGEDPTITVLQANAASAGTTKALNFTRIRTKELATLLTTTAETVTDQAAGNTYTNTDWAELQALTVIEVKAEDLDRTNGYYWVLASVADVGSGSQIGGLLYIKGGKRLAA